MINLDRELRQKLIDTIVSIPEMQSDRGRRQILEQSGLGQFISRIDLTGTPVIVAGEIITVLQKYGYNEQGESVLSLLINKVENYIGYPNKQILDDILSDLHDAEIKNAFKERKEFKGKNKRLNERIKQLKLQLENYQEQLREENNKLKEAELKIEKTEERSKFRLSEIEQDRLQQEKVYNQELKKLQEKLQQEKQSNENLIKERDGCNIRIQDLKAQVNKEQLEIKRLKQLVAHNIKIESVNVVTVNPQSQIIQKAPQQFKYFRENLAIGVDLELAEIPAGSFMMGTEDAEIERLCKTYDWEGFKCESPQHQVSVPAFLMSRYPITQAQWKMVAGWEKIERELDPDPSYFKQDYEGMTRWNRPVERVTWDDAIEFCQRLSQKTGKTYRIPTEAEWEYACRAGTSTPFHFGETITIDLANYGIITDLANYNGYSTYPNSPLAKDRGETTPVGYFKVANAFGLYDMHGLVWEWCQDDWHDSYENAPDDGTAWLSGNGTKVLRGGSWYDYPYNCRSAYRDNNCNREHRNYDIGFRVVCGFGRNL